MLLLRKGATRPVMMLQTVLLKETLLSHHTGQESIEQLCQTANITIDLLYIRSSTHSTEKSHLLPGSVLIAGCDQIFEVERPCQHARRGLGQLGPIFHLVVFEKQFPRMHRLYMKK